MMAGATRMRTLALWIAIGLASSLAGCAGARVHITAANAHYPVSMSPVVRDMAGLLHDERSLQQTGRFKTENTSLGFVYSGLAPGSPYDISSEIDRQVLAAAGEAVVNLTVSIRSSCSVLNAFPILNALPIWPGCVPISVTGDIVRRLDAAKGFR